MGYFFFFIQRGAKKKMLLRKINCIILLDYHLYIKPTIY